MGNAFKCQSCGPATNHSVFTFSEDLVLKFSEGRPPKGLTAAEMRAMDNVGDQELFNELRCMDDSHSRAYGLTPSRVQMLLEHLEAVVEDISIKSSICESEVISKCYENNRECPIKCAEQVTEYDNCVDEKARDKVQEVLTQEKR